jgi:hypothetical protein
MYSRVPRWRSFYLIGIGSLSIACAVGVYISTNYGRGDSDSVNSEHNLDVIERVRIRVRDYYRLHKKLPANTNAAVAGEYLIINGVKVSPYYAADGDAFELGVWTPDGVYVYRSQQRSATWSLLPGVSD